MALAFGVKRVFPVKRTSIATSFAKRQGGAFGAQVERVTSDNRIATRKGRSRYIVGAM